MPKKPATKKPSAKKPATNYPEPKLAKGQVVGYTEFFTIRGAEKVPVAAYPVSTTPHLLVHRNVTPNETWDGVKTLSGWNVIHGPTGGTVSPGLDTLKDTMAVAEKMGRLGDWSTVESVRDTVPHEAKYALRNIQTHKNYKNGWFYISQMNARLDQLYREQESQKQAEAKSAKPKAVKAVKSKSAKPKAKTVTFKDGKGMAKPSGKKQAQDVPVDEPPGRRRTPASKGRGQASKDKGRKVNIKMS